MQKYNHLFSVFGLLFGAICWGIIWYPYRLMQEEGVSGVASSFYTYSIAVFIGAVLFYKRLPNLWKVLPACIWLAVVAGWTNLSYVLAVIDGEVMRVMLLFYLSPVWTMILAWLVLKEPIDVRRLFAIMLALTGAFVMLWEPGEWPIPQNNAEWFALSSGVGFSLTNVTTRHADHLSIAAKSMAVWVGVLMVSWLYGELFDVSFPSPIIFSALNWGVMTLIALLLVSATLLVQFGVTHLPANRASVIFLFELVVAAIASYVLVNEVMTVNEWIGGGLIVMAALYAALSERT